MQEQQRVFDHLEALDGVTVYPSRTNFLMFRTPDAARFYEALLAEGVLIRRQDHLPQLDNCLRVSIGTASENDAFLAAAERVTVSLKELSYG